MPDWASIREAPGVAGIGIIPESATAVGGGSINAAWRVETPNAPVFVKTAAAESLAMLEAEACGLEALAKTGEIRVPEPVACGVAGGNAYLVLEWLDLCYILVLSFRLLFCLVDEEVYNVVKCSL